MDQAWILLWLLMTSPGSQIIGWQWYHPGIIALTSKDLIVCKSRVAPKLWVLESSAQVETNHTTMTHTPYPSTIHTQFPEQYAHLAQHSGMAVTSRVVPLGPWLGDGVKWSSEPSGLSQPASTEKWNTPSVIQCSCFIAGYMHSVFNFPLCRWISKALYPGYSHRKGGTRFFYPCVNIFGAPASILTWCAMESITRKQSSPFLASTKMVTLHYVCETPSIWMNYSIQEKHIHSTSEHCCMQCHLL